MAALPENKPWVLYLLSCRGNRLYTGITNNLEARLEAHRAGSGSKFVRAFMPFELAGSIICPDAVTARRMEARVKKMKHVEKLVFVQTPRAENSPQGKQPTQKRMARRR